MIKNILFSASIILAIGLFLGPELSFISAQEDEFGLPIETSNFSTETENAVIPINDEVEDR